MTFTIEELEALKEGTTPGPWAVKRETPTMQHDYFTIHRQGDHRTRIKGHTYGHGQDPDLIAAAPALVDALIAEKRAHQELRAEVEKLRDVHWEKYKELDQHATWLERQCGVEPFRDSVAQEAEDERKSAARLTRILEGDND